MDKDTRGNGEGVHATKKPSQGLTVNHGLGWLGIRDRKKASCLGGASRRWPLQTQGRVAREHSGETIDRDIFGRYWLSVQQEKYPT